MTILIVITVETDKEIQAMKKNNEFNSPKNILNKKRFILKLQGITKMLS